MSRKAFTLIEILIVLAIMSVGIVSVTPILGERTAEGDPQVAFFTELLAEHLLIAQEYGIPISVTGFKGSANIMKYDGTRVAIPDIKSVQSVAVNGEDTGGAEYQITVYPDGLCDHFIIETDSDITFESYPILMTVTKIRDE
ncbi:MAG: type II secretion system GspH family protein [Deferribacteraceae bacterium]|jgi:prepilin-type N-terminal cleavage/methylation domain-containing protein|nr:type II secretion system GspH family protein [Deferribacteraceae bacterium]